MQATACVPNGNINFLHFPSIIFIIKLWFRTFVDLLFRCLRTELLRCSSDVEYLCKLHCIRLAFQYLFQDESKRTWISNTGRQILADLLLYANKVRFFFCFVILNLFPFSNEKPYFLSNFEVFELRLHSCTVMLPFTPR